MKDQAERLRQLAKQGRQKKYSSPNSRVIAVASGKGGVGKTNFTVNLALALQAAGKKTMVFDADLGMANIDIILGVVPNYTLTHVIKRQKSMKEILLDGPGGIKILPGSSGAQELVDLSEYQVQSLINDWQTLDEYFDFIFIDTGAGIHSDVLNFLRAADEIIIVLTPEPPSITDAYGLIKVLFQQELTSSIHLLINQVKNIEEGKQLFSRISKVVEEFLHTQVNLFGIIPYDEKVSLSVRRQTPFFIQYPNSNASKGIRKIVQQLLNNMEATSRKGMKQFFQEMLGYFSN